MNNERLNRYLQYQNEEKMEELKNIQLLLTNLSNIATANK